MRKLILIPIVVLAALFIVPMVLLGSIDKGVAYTLGLFSTGLGMVVPWFETLPYYPLIFGVLTGVLGFGVGYAWLKGKLFWRWGSRGTKIITGEGQQQVLGTYDTTKLVRSNPTEQKLPELVEEKPKA